AYELLLQSLCSSEQQLLDPPVARACANITSRLFELDESYFEDPTIWEHITSDPTRIRFNSLRLYGTVWSTSPTTVSSAFGLARLVRAETDVETAIGTVARVRTG